MTDDLWVVRRTTLIEWSDLPIYDYLSFLPGPFAYPKWTTHRAVVLGKSEAHQHAMGFGSPHNMLTSYLAIPAIWVPGVSLEPKWRPRSAAELRELERSPFTGGL